LATAGCSSEGQPGTATPIGTTHRIARPSIAGIEDEPPPATLVPKACDPNRQVLTADMTNARDLGGTPLPGGGAVVCGAIYRGPPLRLSEQGCSDATHLNLRTVLDLREEGERSSAPDADCVEAGRVFAPLPIPYGLAAADYLRVLHDTASIATVFRTFGDATAYPIYFHCTIGRDRTGVVGALVLLALGASRATVMEEYLLSQPLVGAYPDSLNAVLDEIEQRGGADAVLRDAGITDAELTVLRERATASR
jgi:protein-tyrosine phosphatase